MHSEKITVGAGTDYPLKGLLTLPDDLSGTVPAVVMVHGSGPGNMDEKVMKLTPFKDLAEGLAEHGVASLRYDKRTYAHGFKLIRQKHFTLERNLYKPQILTDHLPVAGKNFIQHRKLWIKAPHDPLPDVFLPLLPCISVIVFHISPLPERNCRTVSRTVLLRYFTCPLLISWSETASGYFNKVMIAKPFFQSQGIMSPAYGRMCYLLLLFRSMPRCPHKSLYPILIFINTGFLNIVCQPFVSRKSLKKPSIKR